MPSTLHVAIIMDGNGRWATRKAWRRADGHRAGAEAVRRTVEAAPGMGIAALTLYAFSADNWERPSGEVNALMSLFQRYLQSETAALTGQGVRLEVIGRRDRLPVTLVRQIEAAEAATAEGDRLHLRIAIDYSARDAVLFAARRAVARGGCTGRDAFAHLLAEVLHAREPVPDVDLLIRTGGEQRLSDFLLWECAYAEIVFRPTLWPDWTADELAQAVHEFSQRERRFGRLPAAS